MKLLSEKYQTSERNIYYDAETRNTWQPVLTQLFDLDKARLVVMNRYDFLYRQASLHFQTASESQKPIYLSKMVEVTDRLVALLGLEYICKAAKTVEEATQLIEAGFQHVTDIADTKLFRKLKTSYLGS